MSDQKIRYAICDVLSKFSCFRNDDVLEQDVLNTVHEAVKPFTLQLRDMADAPMDGTSVDLYVRINGGAPFRIADCNNEGKGWVFDSGLSILHHYKGKKLSLLGWTPILQVAKNGAA